MLFKDKTGLRGKSERLVSLRTYCLFTMASTVLFISSTAMAAFPTQASGNGSVANTRHNLTVAYSTNQTFMDIARNDYEEVCVYCHTPHGGNQAEPNLPLWNHTIPDKNSFTLYSANAALNQMTSIVSVPGPASLTCLSCHDGTIAIDSIINMPTRDSAGTYSTGYRAAQDTTTNNAFLNSWSQVGVGPPPGSHFKLTAGQCLLCHSGVIAPDFSVFEIGKNLGNDHPIGVIYPAATGPATDFKQPSDTTADGRIKFFEDAVGGSGSPSTNNNNHLNTNEIRLYNSTGVAGEFEVECASCHDPHGVPNDGSTPWAGAFNVTGLSRSGVQFNNSFLRISNSDSDVCLTCHDK